MDCTMHARLIHSICVAEFDELKGNTLSHTYPADAQPEITSHSRQQIAELCLPDGGHKHTADSIYLLLTGASGVPLYGFAYFRNRKDESSRRGAKQLAVLVIATLPYFDRFRPFLSVAVDEYLDKGQSPAVIEALHRALELSYAQTKRLAERRGRSFEGEPDLLGNADASPTETACSTGCPSPTSASLGRGSVYFGRLEKLHGPGSSGLLSSSCTYTMHLWGRMFVMQPLKPLRGNEFGGASLRDLVVRFRAQTMTLWAALLSLKRILVCSPESNAETVGNLVLSTPLLLGPLGELVVPNLTPYVTLADVEPVTKHSSYVCGTTNCLFATKEQWFDVAADPANGKVVISAGSNVDRSWLKVQGQDLSFINRVIDGIESDRRDEEWVRFEFATFTQDFLDAVRELEVSRLSKHERRGSAGAGPTLSHEAGLPWGAEFRQPQPRSQTPQNQRHSGDASAKSMGSEPGGDAARPSRRQPALKWQRSRRATAFLKRKASKVGSEKLALTFAGSPLWLRYRWMQLNPESLSNGAHRAARIRAIALRRLATDTVSRESDGVDAGPEGFSRAPSSERSGLDQWASEEDEDAASGGSSDRARVARNSFDSLHSCGHGASGSSMPGPEERGRWRRAVSADGKVYYWDVETLATRWHVDGAGGVEVNPACEHAPAAPRAVSQGCQTAYEPAQWDGASGLSPPPPEPLNGDAGGCGGDDDDNGSEDECEKSHKWVMANGRWRRVRVVVQEDIVNNARKKSDWVEACTAQGERYYWNVSTGETRWQVETVLDGAGPPSRGFATTSVR